MIPERLQALRHLMEQHKIQAYLVPSTDPHGSEYVPACWQRRQWLSGFTGSAGELVITLQEAGLWTDSRYFLQAEEQLQGTGIRLFKIGLPETPDIPAWLGSVLQPGDAVGIDPRLFSHKEAEKLEKELRTRGLSLKSIEDNLVDAIWEDRPEFPRAPARPHPLRFAGETVESKLNRVREKMAEVRANAHVVTTLDAIAWLLNIRGNDVEYNPVVISYAIVTEKDARLFIPSYKVTEELRKHLEGQVEIFPYEDFKTHLEQLAHQKTRVWLDAATVSRWVVDVLQNGAELLFKDSPITWFKAIKNETEIEGFRQAHVRDGVAMVKFLHWLEQAVPAGGVTEISAAEQAEKFRREQENYQGPSFHPISAYGAHGAIVHYSATPESDVELQPQGIFLFDSGGQYLDGTTDITRTVALGSPTREQKEHFTRVLKGHIQLALTRFPRNTAGNQLDTIARKPLWDVGLNYGHGTGHGVGSYLNVHEGPQGISYYRGIGVPMEVGMVTSNEPGYYREGAYGIRIENLVLTVKDEDFSSGENEFYTFETITLCPIDLKLVAVEMLTPAERRWLNEYHRRVREVLSPFLDEAERAWLQQATREI